MDKLNIDCILLAAGESLRMGYHKQRIRIGGKSLVQHNIDLAYSICRRIIVVQGAVDLSDLVPRNKNIILVHNPNYHTGQLSSLQVGMEMTTTPLFFVYLADLVGVQPETFRLIATAISENHVAYPTCGNRRGHPVLLNQTAADLLKLAPPDGRAMHIVQPLNPLAVPVEDTGIYTDIDTENDLIRLREMGIIKDLESN